MIQIEQLPRDADGIVKGAWRVVHQSPTFHGDLGHVSFVEGVATSPAFGVRLLRLIVSYGGDLFVEPWTGPFPTDFALPEAVSNVISDDELAKLPLAPWREKVADAMEPLTLEILRFGGEDGEQAVAMFAEMIRSVPTLTPIQALALRAELMRSDEDFGSHDFVEIPKLFKSTIEQLDGIIAAAGGEDGIAKREAELDAVREKASAEIEAQRAAESRTPTTPGDVLLPAGSAMQNPETDHTRIGGAPDLMPPIEAPIVALEAGPADALPPVLDEPKASTAHAPTAPELVEQARIIVAHIATDAIPIIHALDSIAAVRAVQELELHTKKRATVLAALDKRIAELTTTP